ncbi:MAG: sigma 54-interacting transcriptional regulator [Terriglobales bacterium]|jgi:formate hydrogenlyase transcriptional activator
MTITEDRYRMLLGASSALADQPTVKAVLQSLRGVLSSTSRLHAAELYVLSDDGENLYSFEFDRDADAPAINRGAKLLRIGLVARVLEEQKPVFIPDSSQEMLKHPDLAPFAAEVAGRSAYLFPVSTAQKRYGILATPKLQGQQFTPEDLEMLSALASHVAVALECALARDTAELYHREVVKQRDRLSLLLEINNHIVSKLEAEELFQAVAGSMRKHLGNDMTSLWLLNKQLGSLERKFLDFPAGKGFLEKVVVVEPTKLWSEWSRLRIPQFYSPFEADIPSALREASRSESLLSAVLVPLLSVDGPLGLLTMCSRRANGFNEADRDLLSQIGTQISLVLENALAYGRLRASRDDLEEQRLYLESEIESEYNFEDIVGRSAAIRKVLDQVAIVAPTSSTVLLHGETGTGKELVARAIHTLSPRRERTFVRLNCAAIPSGLVESELFGHEKGAFTGALIQKRGRFELADHGTLFLDEIGDITLELQPKLLRALQEQEFERLGSTRTIKVDVRLIAATHRDLEGMIRNNQFREDLFYRLRVFPIEIPPLRERREDIQLLVHFFVSRLSRRMQKRIRSVPRPAMEALVNADWPGNIRELENFIERCVILTQGDELNVPRAELNRSAGRTVIAATSTFEQAERQAIVDALKTASGRIAGRGGAAERLGLKRTTLQNKMRRLSITRADYSA